jgi:hypothetical protein
MRFYRRIRRIGTPVQGRTSGSVNQTLGQSGKPVTGVRTVEVLWGVRR